MFRSLLTEKAYSDQAQELMPKSLITQSSTSKKPSILIVEDDPNFRVLLKRMFSNQDYEIHEAENGVVGLTRYQQLSPNLMLIDAMMPELNGFELCEQLQKLPGGKQIPVLMLTALSDTASIERAFQVGAADYITKPVQWSVLLQRVERLLHVQRTEVTLRAEIEERTKAEATLAQERNYLRTLIDHLPDYIFIKDRFGHFVISNLAHAQAAKAMPEDLIGKTAADFFPAELTAQYDLDDRLIMDAGKPLVNVERLSLDANGALRWMLTTKVPLIDAEGAVIGLAGLSHDITEIKEAERRLNDNHDFLEKQVSERTAALSAVNEALRIEIAERQRIENELQYRIELEMLIAAISTYFIDLDPTNIDQGINRALLSICKFAGVDRSYVFLLSEDGRTLRNTHEWHISDIEPQKEHYQDIPIARLASWVQKLHRFEDIAITVTDSTLSDSSTERKFLESRSVQSVIIVPMLHSGSLMGFLGFDAVHAAKAWPQEVITLFRIAGEIIISALEHKRTEHALHRSEEHLRRLTDNMLDIIYEADENGIIEFASPSCWNVLGYAPEAMIGQSIYQWVHPDDVVAMKEAIQTVGRVEYRHCHARGDYLWVETLSNFLFSNDHQIKGIIFASRDITERKRAEKELQELTRLKTEFLSTAAHELRTPLASIRGFSEILYTRDLDPARQKRYLKLINEQSEHLAALIDDLLDISRLEAKRRLTLTLEPIDMTEVLQKVLSPFEEWPSMHQIRMERLTVCPPILGDAFRLSQICKNLLSNAIKYSPKGGLITVKMQLAENCLVISVSDQGIGMTSDQQAHLFEKFYRADASNTASNGTGLGLAISRQLVELHGGQIWAESEPGVGTTFSFSLPLDSIFTEIDLKG